MEIKDGIAGRDYSRDLAMSLVSPSVHCTLLVLSQMSFLSCFSYMHIGQRIEAYQHPKMNRLRQSQAHRVRRCQLNHPIPRTENLMGLESDTVVGVDQCPLEGGRNILHCSSISMCNLYVNKTVHPPVFD